MRKFFTGHYWHGVADRLRSRLGRPRKLRQDLEDRLTLAVSGLRGSDGVDLVRLDVWSEGPKPCKEHCWHPVDTSVKHKHAAGAKSNDHDDFICCRCTHGLCRIGAHEKVDK